MLPVTVTSASVSVPWLIRPPPRPPVPPLAPALAVAPAGVWPPVSVTPRTLACPKTSSTVPLCSASMTVPCWPLPAPSIATGPDAMPIERL
jgi:hypothetical protein